MNQQDAATAAGKIFFIDDTQISSMEGVKRQLHPARKHEGNPLVTSDKDWEAPAILLGTVRKEGNQYRMWYQSQATCPGANTFDSYRRFLHLYAESEDGLSWMKPALGFYEDSMGSYENNIAFVRLALSKDMNPSVLYTPHMDHGRVYTMLTYGSGYDVPYSGYVLAYSDDGIRWTDGPKTPAIPGYGDIGWFTHDEEDGILRGMVTWDRVPGPAWTQSSDGHEWALPWPAPLPDQEDNDWAGDDPSSSTVFHGMPIFRHGPVILGFLQVLRGHEVPGQGLDGKMDVQLVCSRNGRDWERVGDRRPILELGEEGSWDSGLLWTGNSLLADDDRMIVYYSGCERTPGALARSS